MALVKYNNNSISSVTAVGLTSGDMNLITTNTISSGVSSSSFTSNINSTYDTYLFKFINIHPATDAAKLQVNFRDGSSAFDATKTTTVFNAQHNEADGSTELGYQSGNDLAQGTGYQDLTRNTGNGNDESVSGELFLFSPSSTTFVKHFTAKSNSYFANDQTENLYVSGYCNVTAAIDGVDFKFSSGNIDSGVIKMYGLSKS
tara:strand:+ start:17 stop:622 length:606 start_codon:yes stop_codon:yes gene_type:complete